LLVVGCWLLVVWLFGCPRCCLGLLVAVCLVGALHRLLVVGFWLLVIGCWRCCVLSVEVFGVAGHFVFGRCFASLVGCWLLVVGRWLLVVGVAVFGVGRGV